VTGNIKNIVMAWKHCSNAYGKQRMHTLNQIAASRRIFYMAVHHKWSNIDFTCRDAEWSLSISIIAHTPIHAGEKVEQHAMVSIVLDIS
jgi:hypothetical protein